MITTGDITAHLRPGLAAVFGNYATYPEQWKHIFKTYKSELHQEIEVEDKYLGPAQFFDQGQPIKSDNMQQAVLTSYIHRKVGLNFIITQEAIDDNLYKKEFPDKAASLRNSLSTTKNTLGANILNQGFNPAYPIGDGQPLFSTMHPTMSGQTYSNMAAVPSAFSEAGLEAAVINIQGLIAQSGILAQVMPKKLILPRQLQFNASRLLHSTFRISTANNDINALYHDDYIPEGYAINMYLLSPTAWFVLTDAENGMKHYQRTPITTSSQVDYFTDNAMFKAWERYSFGCSNARSMYGNQGA